MTSSPPAPAALPTSPGPAVYRVAARVADLVIDVLVAGWRLMRRGVVALANRLPSRPFDRLGGRVWTAATHRVGVRADVLTNPSSIGMRRLAIAGVVVNVFIVASGGLVRLTSSGLGCPTWPRCTPESLLPARHVDTPMSQTLIEFGNRTLTFVLLLVAITVFVAALHLRPQRPDLARLAVVQPLGVVCQALLGGVTVLTGLHPASVGAHYLLSAVVLVACVALHVRAMEGDRPARQTLPRAAHRLAVALPFAGFLLLAAGTVVTGAGPHAGDETAPRYDFLGVETVVAAAKVHAAVMWVTVLGVVGLYILARRSARTVVVRRTFLLLGVIALQGLIGYVQYFTGVPGQLVLLHVLGSALFWVTLLYARFAARTRGPAEPLAADTHPRLAVPSAQPAA